jgi:hypothetical protein
LQEKRNAHLLGTCDENRRKEKKREEARNRRKALHFKPPAECADGSTSPLGELPSITFIEPNPPSRDGGGLSMHSRLFLSCC